MQRFIELMLVRVRDRLGLGSVLGLRLGLGLAIGVLSYNPIVMHRPRKLQSSPNAHLWGFTVWQAVQATASGQITSFRPQSRVFLGRLHLQGAQNNSNPVVFCKFVSNRWEFLEKSGNLIWSGKWTFWIKTCFPNSTWTDQSYQPRHKSCHTMVLRHCLYKAK